MKGSAKRSASSAHSQLLQKPKKLSLQIPMPLFSDRLKIVHHWMLSFDLELEEELQRRQNESSLITVHQNSDRLSSGFLALLYEMPICPQLYACPFLRKQFIDPMETASDVKHYQWGCCF
ncbi:hypothetical protein H920_05912 [Fukomys damarensis]|uniref:Uncharacterized protein n=1 Tax=Fukomys damarensis TaxID=885580 RepID=A0A091DQL0_FUKDA|nr:hypothetical protein H920_05912 [Fukomys damarensis]